MAATAKLRDIVDSLQMASDERVSYLDRTTGEVVDVSGNEMSMAEEGEPPDGLPDWRREDVELARRISEDSSGNFVSLPTPWDVNEHAIMEEFCDSLPAGQSRDTVCISIKGRGAYRRFKDSLHVLGLAERWYRYRDEKFKEIAIEWCRENNIPYVDDVPAR